MFKAFDEGKGLVSDSLTSTVEIEHLIGLNKKIKWGNEEKLGFRRIDIKKEEYPIVIFQRDGGLWWDNYKEEEEDEVPSEDDKECTT